MEKDIGSEMITGCNAETQSPMRGAGTHEIGPSSVAFQAHSQGAGSERDQSETELELPLRTLVL